MNTTPVNILTLKWGALYSTEYVNLVFRGSKHIDGRTRPCPWVKELWEL